MGLTKNNYKDKKVELIINTISTTWEKETISYEEVAALAFPKSINLLYTITFYRGENNADGFLYPKKTVKVVNKMIFNVVYTNDA